jgi:hypothetical protein
MRKSREDGHGHDERTESKRDKYRVQLPVSIDMTLCR